jgi:hypothetical protein
MGIFEVEHRTACFGFFRKDVWIISEVEEGKREKV